MTTRLIIARHGNTFTKDQTPTRVGGRTDLPLGESERGTNIGKYLKLKNMLPRQSKNGEIRMSIRNLNKSILLQQINQMSFCGFLKN